MIFFEHGPGDRPLRFDRALRMIRADTADEVPGALEALDRARAGGAWLAGFASYELGYALEPRLAPLMPADRGLPLIAFGAFEDAERGEAFLDAAAALAPRAGLSDPAPDWTAADHAAAVTRVLDYIGAGDIYQANLTFRMHAWARGPAAGLYAALRQRQRVRHAAYLDLPDLPAILSRSPELFFATDADGRIETRPMKGTAPRDPDPARELGRLGPG
jgi:para-aminobenzoate synthetase component 1